MGIACVPHLPQKIFSHFLCEGLCHGIGHGIGHFIGLSHLIGLCHSHGIGHFMDLGIYLGIGIGLCLGLCHFIGLGLGLCLGLKRKNSAEAELFSKGQSGHRISHNLNSSTIGSHNRFRTFKNHNRRT